MSPFESTGTFAAALASALPVSAQPLASDGAEGFAWHARSGPAVDRPLHLGLDAEGGVVAGLHVPGAPPRAHLLPVLRDLGLDGRSPARSLPFPPEPRRADFAARFAEALDLQAARLVAESRSSDVEAYHWLAGRGPERPGRHALARDYPWAVDAILESGGEIWDDTPEDVACDLLRSGDLSGCGPEGTLRHVVRHVRGLRFEGFDRRVLAGDLRAMTFLPKAWIPTSPSDTESLAALAPHLLSHALAGGLPLAEVMRPGDGWGASLARICARAANAGPGATPRDGAAAAARLVRDMVEAFQRQVVWPAACMVEPVFRDHPPRTVRGGRRAPTGLSVVAHRLLLGGKGFPAAVEAAARWAGGLTAIANVVAGAAASEDVRWAPAFAPLRDRLGVDLACVSDAGEMLREARELGHCVCTYLPRCLAGESVIASVRAAGRDGAAAERLSTVELRWDAGGGLRPVQHHGVANGPPPDVAALALRRFSSLLLRGEVALERRGDPASANATLLSLYVDRYVAMRDAWAPHLPSALRGLPPDGMLACAGLTRAALREAAEAAASRAVAPGAHR